MVGPGVLAGRPGRQVCIVIQLRRRHGPVYVAVQELDEDLGALARQMVRAPVGACLCARHAEPGAGTVVAWRVAGVVAMTAVRKTASQRTRATLPRKLHLDAQIAARGNGRVLRRHHHGHQAFGRRGLGAPFRHQRRRRGQRVKVIAVRTVLQIRRAQHLGGLATQVIGGLVQHAQEGIAVSAHFIERLTRARGVTAVLGQGEIMARHHLPGRPAAVETHHPGFMRLQAARDGKFRVVAVGIAAMAVVVVVFQERQGAGLHIGLRMRRVREQLALVPGQTGDGVGPYRAGCPKARNAVLGFGGVATVKAQRGVGAGRPRRACVEHHQAVARAARGVAVLFVLLMIETEAEAGFGQDAQHKRQIGFAVLRA